MAIRDIDMVRLGFMPGPLLNMAVKSAEAAITSGLSKDEVVRRMREVRNDPESFIDDLLFADVAWNLVEAPQTKH